MGRGRRAREPERVSGWFSVPPVILILYRASGQAPLAVDSPSAGEPVRLPGPRGEGRSRICWATRSGKPVHCV